MVVETRVDHPRFRLGGGSVRFEPGERDVVDGGLGSSCDVRRFRLGQRCLLGEGVPHRLRLRVEVAGDDDVPLKVLEGLELLCCLRRLTPPVDTADGGVAAVNSDDVARRARELDVNPGCSTQAVVRQDRNSSVAVPRLGVVGIEAR